MNIFNMFQGGVFLQFLAEVQFNCKNKTKCIHPWPTSDIFLILSCAISCLCEYPCATLNILKVSGHAFESCKLLPHYTAKLPVLI